MYDNNAKTSLAGLGACIPDAVRPSTLTERMESEKERLEYRLKEINNVLEQLKKNPEVQSLLDAIQRVSGVY